jgi:prepilin-type processing-associated H-X9-DG protein
MNRALPKETITMPTRWLPVLCLLLLTLAPGVRAQPPAADTPQAVAQAFMQVMSRLPQGGDQIFQEVLPLVLAPPAENGPGPRPYEFYAIAMLTWLQTACGAQTLPQPAAPGDRATVYFQPPPLPLVLVQVNGHWKVDIAATFKAMPDGVHQFAQMQQQQAQQATCLSNLKQLALAALMFANDHDQQLPEADKWMDELAPYIKDPKILQCPAAPQLKYGYAMNAALSGQLLDKIPQPASTVLFFESDLGTRNAAGGAEAVCQPGRHNGGNCFAFVDGHAQWWRGAGFPTAADLQPATAPPPHPETQGAGGPPPPG